MASVKAGTKYFPLFQYLKQSGKDELTLTIAEIESIIGQPLPSSAYENRGWWSNRSEGAVQAAAWMGAGFHTEELDLEAKTVTFRKPGRVYHVQREGDTILWDGDLVKALRHHMGMNQAQFAQELGVRQPTISEWETGAYSPRRSSSKLLTLIAEKAGFTYE